jgi:hypothetical protein
VTLRTPYVLSIGSYSKVYIIRIAKVLARVKSS